MQLCQCVLFVQVRWVYNLPNPETPFFPIAQFLPVPWSVVAEVCGRHHVVFSGSVTPQLVRDAEVLKQAIDEFEPDLLICASKGGAYATGLWKAGLWDGPTLLINRRGRH